MKHKFLILGGDMRSIYLAQMLEQEGNKVYVYGLEKNEKIMENKLIEKVNSLKSAIEKAEIIIAPTPLTKDGIEINTPFSAEKILIDDLIKSNKSKIFIAGSIKNEIKEKLNSKYSEVIDVMAREELAILNTIATAEGTVEVAIKNTDKILQGANVLILGFGRVAKIVANKFQALSAKVTCSARKISDLAWIEAYGYSALDINDMLYDLKDFDIIINTVPQVIMHEKELKHMNPNVLLIDLASAPGGIDSKMAENMGLKYVWALALPGKVAPTTSAKFIKETIGNVLEEIDSNKKKVEWRDKKMEKISKKL